MTKLYGGASGAGRMPGGFPGGAGGYPGVGGGSSSGPIIEVTLFNKKFILHLFIFF